MSTREKKKKPQQVMHGSIPPVTMPLSPRATPGTSPALRARGWRIVRSGLCPGGRVGQIGNRSSETRLLRNEQWRRRKRQEISLGNFNAK